MKLLFFLYNIPHSSIFSQDLNRNVCCCIQIMYFSIVPQSHLNVLVFLFKMHWRFFLHCPLVYLCIKANTVGSGSSHTLLCFPMFLLKTDKENVHIIYFFVLYNQACYMYQAVPFCIKGNEWNLPQTYVFMNAQKR